MADKSDLKLLGKLGLELSQLKKDINTMESLINKANTEAGKLGKVWKNIANEMNNAFKSFPLNEFTKTLNKFEQIQKKGLDKLQRNTEKFQNAERRREEKHLQTMLIQRQKADFQMALQREKHQQKLLLNREKYEQKELNSYRNHIKSLQQLERQVTSPTARRFNSLTDYLIASSAIYGTQRAFREVIKVNREFEKEQVNLQRVLKATAEEMESVKDMTLEVGKATGNSIKDIQAIENLWIRTGRNNLQELEELTRVTAIGLNTAQFKDAGESVAFLNGAINQMVNGDWTQAQAILDSWAKTADNTAVRATEDLAEVISRAGSQAKMLGLNFHDLNAITAILAERMAIDGKRIGTAMKTIFARISDPSYYKTLQSYGVDVFKEGTKELKSFVDIMNELNQKYKEFKNAGNDSAISNMLKALGGTRRRPEVMNLIEGWERYGEIVEISMSSSGYAMEQNEKIMETFDKQVEVLKVSLAELALTIGENGLIDAIQGLVEGTSSAINWFESLNPHVKNTITVATELALAFGALNLAQKRITKIGLIEYLQGVILKSTGIKNMAESYRYLNDLVAKGNITRLQATRIYMALDGQMRMSKLTTQELTVARQAQTLATYEATSATYALSTALNVALVGIPIIIGLITTWNNSKKELNRTMLDSIKNEQQEIEQVDNLISEYEELKGKTELATNEKNRLKDIEETLIELMPQSVNAIYDQNMAYETQIATLKRLSEEKKKALLEEAQIYLKANQSEYKKAEEKIKNINKRISNAESYLTTYGWNWNNSNPQAVVRKPSEEKVGEYQQKLINERKKWEKIKSEYEKNKTIVNEITKLLKEGSSKPKTSSRTNTASTSRRSYSNNNNIPFDPEDVEYELNALRHEYNMDKLSKQQYANKLKTLLNKYRNNLQESEVWGIEEEIHNLLSNKKASSSSGSSVNSFPKGLKAIMDTLEHELKMDKIDGDEYADRLQSALDKYRGQLNKQAIWSIEEKIYSLRKQSNVNLMDIDYDEFTKSIELLNHEISLLEKQEELINTLGKEKSTLIPLLSKRIDRYKKSQEELNKVNGEYKILINDIDNLLNSLNPSTVNYDRIVKQLTEDKKRLTAEIRKNTLSIYDNQIAVAKLEAQMQDYVESALKEAYTLQQQMASTKLDERQAKEIEKLKRKQELYNDSIDKKIEKKRKELELLDEEIAKEEYLNEINELQAEIEKVKADTRYAYIDEKTGKEIYTYDRAKVAELEKQIVEKERDRANEIRKNKLQDEIEALEEEARIKNEKYDEQLDDLQRHHEEERREFEIYWNKRLSDEYIKQQAINLIKQEGYTNALLIAQQYFSDMETEYDKSSQSAYEGGKDITESLAEGLFEEIDEIIDVYKQKIRQLASLRAQASSSSGGYISSVSGGGGSNRNPNWNDAQNDAHKKANSARSTLEDWGYGKGAHDIQSHDYEGAKKWYDDYVKDRTDLSDAVKEKFKEIVDAKKQWEDNNYHTGGFVGGKPLDPRHEEIAKLLKGELVLPINTLNKLSLALPKITYSSINLPSKAQSNINEQKPIMIRIENLTPSDFDDFMKSIEPYITSHK